MSNLNRLFNTRQGSVGHLPDYGLPDITSVYREAPESIDMLRRAIKDVVQKYEPRLRRVHVERQETNDYAMRLIFIVSAELLNGERVQFETTFRSQESARVTPAGSYR
jgi:type VI secretion system protein